MPKLAYHRANAIYLCHYCARSVCDAVEPHNLGPTPEEAVRSTEKDIF